MLVPLLPLSDGFVQADDKCSVFAIVRFLKQVHLRDVAVLYLVVIFGAMHPHEVCIQLDCISATRGQECAQTAVQLTDQIALHITAEQLMQAQLGKHADTQIRHNNMSSQDG